jgi:hypothetical protein
MNSLPAMLSKVTPAACLLGLTLIITGCSAEQEQSEPVFTYVHGASYGQSTVSLPQNLRHHQRAPRAAQLRHAAPPPEAFTGGN